MFSTSKLFLSASSKLVGVGGVVTYVDDYAIHTFTSSGSILFSGEGDVDILIVAGGGGGGGNYSSGGGGAGGLLYLTNQPTKTGLYNITVGLGGPVQTNGGHSSIVGPLYSYTALGGGYGGIGQYIALQNGASGGSGGGAGRTHVATPGNGTAGQGNNGGLAISYSYRLGSTNYTGRSGGGGGGAGGVGSNAYRVSSLSSDGGNGGIGRLIDINGFPTYYAGGGGGGGYRYSTNAPGGISGSGGLGGGGSESNGTNGLGGGGGEASSGGSGIVIVRYLR
jgi:hypothetical protein